MNAIVGRSLASVFAAAILSMLAACDRPRGSEAQPSDPPAPSSAADRGEGELSVQNMIRTQPVRQEPLPLSEILPARIVYDEDRTARVTTSFSGRIARLIASPGDGVRIGTPLAEIDSPDFGLAASDLAKARADELHKRLALVRARDLLTGGVIPQKDVEAAEADFEQAHAETTRAEQRMNNLDPARSAKGGGHFLLTSPIAGIVTERNANPAMEVNPTLAQPLFVISDLKRLWVLIDVPERLLGQIRKGVKVSIETDAFAGRRFSATVVHVAQILDPATRRIAVRAETDNAQLDLRPEMFVRATILRDDGTGIRVPNEALVTAGLYTYVYQQGADHAFRRVQVEPIVKGSEYTYIRGALKDGDEIVTSGALLLAADRPDGPVKN